jgi:hypothetical protein
VIADEASSAARLPDAFRRVAARHDKPDPHHLAFVRIASLAV